jgi:hypothetical protein
MEPQPIVLVNKTRVELQAPWEAGVMVGARVVLAAPVAVVEGTLVVAVDLETTPVSTVAEAEGLMLFLGDLSLQEVALLLGGISMEIIRVA